MTSATGTQPERDDLSLPAETFDALRADAREAPSMGAQTGLKALAAIAGRLGLDWSLPRLLHVYGSDIEPEARRLATIAQTEGLQCAEHSTNWEGLDKLGKLVPFIARLSTGAYVVVVHAPATFARSVAAAEETVH